MADFREPRFQPRPHVPEQRFDSGGVLAEGVGLPPADLSSQTYLTNIWSLMRAVKTNLIDYTGYEGVLKLNKNRVNWGLGFILPKTVFPAITVFPMSQHFGERRGSGRSIVDYRLSIDIYSPRVRDLAEAKAYCLKAAEDVKRAVTGSHMIDRDKKHHCFHTQVLGVSLAETADNSDRNFQSFASVQISCLAYHNMATDRVRVANQYSTDSDTFLDYVSTFVRKYMPDKTKAKSWLTKVATPTMKTPAVLILPGDEYFEDEVYTQRIDRVIRPVYFNVISKDYPRVDTLQANMTLADELVTGIERAYRVNGYAENAIISSITYDYGGRNKDFRFFSTIETKYECRQEAERVLR